jgi:hypothetical protein
MGKWLLVINHADDLNITFRAWDLKGIVDYLPESEEGVMAYTGRFDRS